MQTPNSPASSNTESTGDKENRRRKVPVRTKVLFASGAFQEATVAAGGLVTVLFYNQILGVAPTLCGTAFLIASVFDGITDPLVGAMSDRFRSRWGRRHPLMLASALPAAISFYFLYQPVDGLSEMGYFIWLTVFMVLMRLAITFYNIPHDALGAELTDDYTERSSVFGYNAVAASLTAILMALVVFFVIFPTTPEYENGLLNASRYYILAGAGAVTIAVSVAVSTVGTLDQIPHIHHVDTTGARVGYGKFFRELGILMGSPSYLSTCLSLITIFTGLGILGVVGTYAYVYVYGLSTEQMTLFGIAKLPGVLTALPLLALLSRWLDKRQILIVAAAITGILISLPHDLKMLDWFPGNDSPYLLVGLLVPLVLGYMILPVAMIVVDSQLVDVADEHEYHTGSRSEGIIFAVRSFAIKSTSGVGGLIAGFGLEYISFPKNAEVGSLLPETIDGLLFLNGPLYLLLHMAAIGFMVFYRIDKTRHGEILAELETRRETASRQSTVNADAG